MSIDSVSSVSASGASSAASVDSEYEQIKKKLAALGISSSGDKATDKAKLEKFESEMKAQQEKEAQKDNEAQKPRLHQALHRFRQNGRLCCHRSGLLLPVILIRIITKR